MAMQHIYFTREEGRCGERDALDPFHHRLAPGGAAPVIAKAKNEVESAVARRCFLIKFAIGCVLIDSECLGKKTYLG